MADSVQCIILCQKAEHRARPGRGIRGSKTRPVPGHVHFYIKPLLFKLLGKGFAGKKLIVADFRPGMDVQGYLTVDRILPIHVLQN